MICDVSHHYCVPGLAKTGLRVLLDCDHVARLWPGYVGALSLVSFDNALKATLVAVWNSMADYHAFAGSPSHARGGTYGLWSQVTQAEYFEVISELKAFPKMPAGNQVASISSGCVVPARLEEGKQALLRDWRMQHDLDGLILHLCLVLEDQWRLTIVRAWESREAYETWKRGCSAVYRSKEEGFWSEPPEEELFEVIPALPWVFSKVPGEALRLLD